MRPIYRNGCYRGNAASPFLPLLFLPVTILYFIVTGLPDAWRECVNEEREVVKSHRYLIGAFLMVAIMFLFFGLVVLSCEINA